LAHPFSENDLIFSTDVPSSQHRGYATRKTIGIVALSKDVLLEERDNLALYTILLGFQYAEEEI
jgi:hypothetical protein